MSPLSSAAVPSPLSVRWRVVPDLLGADDECRAARAAFASVSPRGVLPDAPTPLQRMLYTRMVTSAFIAAVSGRVSAPRPAHGSAS